MGFNDTCWVDGCGRQANQRAEWDGVPAGKLCGRHFQQLHNVGGFFDRRVILNDTCWVDGCGRQGSHRVEWDGMLAGKLCVRHIYQLRNVGGFFDRLVIREKRKLLRPPTQRHSLAAERLRGLIEAGQVRSQSEAARLLGVSRQNVSQLAKRHGIEWSGAGHGCAIDGRRSRPPG